MSALAFILLVTAVILVEFVPIRSMVFALLTMITGVNIIYTGGQQLFQQYFAADKQTKKPQRQIQGLSQKTERMFINLTVNTIESAMFALINIVAATDVKLFVMVRVWKAVKHGMLFILFSNLNAFRPAESFTRFGSSAIFCQCGQCRWSSSWQHSLCQNCMSTRTAKALRWKTSMSTPWKSMYISFDLLLFKVTRLTSHVFHSSVGMNIWNSAVDIYYRAINTTKDKLQKAPNIGTKQTISQGVQQSMRKIF